MLGDLHFSPCHFETQLMLSRVTPGGALISVARHAGAKAVVPQSAAMPLLFTVHKTLYEALADLLMGFQNSSIKLNFDGEGEKCIICLWSENNMRVMS